GAVPRALVELVPVLDLLGQLLDGRGPRELLERIQGRLGHLGLLDAALLLARRGLLVLRRSKESAQDQQRGTATQTEYHRLVHRVPFHCDRTSPAAALYRVGRDRNITPGLPGPAPRPRERPYRDRGPDEGCRRCTCS